MSYLVLARKWRPQVFEDVVGQEHVTRTLQNAIKTGRVAHAYLFTGARGVGKTSAARILAKALNCINGPTPVPCNTCESCKEIAGGSSMDVFEIDGASNTGVDDIRELRENIKFPPIKCRYRIYIIDEVHMLSTNAFNALLKTLEEPPPHVIFVFATTDPQKIPVTILSRCQEFDFKRIPALLIQERLKTIAESEKIKITDRGLHIIAREADGGMRDAQSILDQVISFAGEDVSDEDVAKSLGVIDREVLKNVVKSIMERTPAGCIQLVERVYDYGYDVRLFCKNLLEYLRNLMVIKVVKDPGQLIDLPDGEIAELKTLSDGFTQDELQQLFAILSRGEEELKRSSSPRLSLEMTLIKMATLRPLVPIAELIERMKGLEEGIGKVRRPEKKEDEKMGSLEDEKKILTSQPLNLSIPASDEKDSIFIELEEPGDTWKSFMQVVRKKRPPLASKLEHGKLIELNNSMVRIGFNNGIYLDMISKEDIKALEEMLNGYLSRSMKVVIAPLVKESKTHEPVKKEQTRQPIIEEALKVFGGRIVEEKMASN
ncbi:MAG: DNA polymerase III, tau subunit [Deltaproteobacteria bacterium]|nr:DNA polymerase III, tau subunit [Deltaproteobacteria bacterium]